MINHKYIYTSSLAKSLFLIFLMLSILPISIITYISYNNQYDSHLAQTEKIFNSILLMKSNQLLSYFKSIVNDSNMFFYDKFMDKVLKEFNDSNLDINDFINSLKYKEISNDFFDTFSKAKLKKIYNDILLIDSSGNILFTMNKQDDLGKNIYTGKYSKTFFANSCKLSFLENKSCFSDFGFYFPAGTGPVAFISNVIYDKNMDQKGLIVFQISIDYLNSTMLIDEDIGINASAYIIGSDLTTRTNRYKNNNELNEKITTYMSELWLKFYNNLDKKKLLHEISDIQKFSKKIHDYNDYSLCIYQGPDKKEVIGIYKSINILGVLWAVIVETDKKSIFQPINKLNKIIISIFIITILLFIIISIIMFKTTIIPINRLSYGAKKISKGDINYDIEISGRGEIRALAVSFNEMLNNLRKTLKEIEVQNLLKTGIAELNQRIQGINDLTKLGDNIISYIADFLNCQIGALYLADEDQNLKMIASYAYIIRKNVSNKLAFGQGLVGQAALEMKPIVISNCPDDYIQISSALGQAKPHNIIAYPIVLDQKLTGVIELGSFNTFDKFHFSYLEQIAISIGIAFNNVDSRLKTSQMLKKTEEQTQNLKAREEELIIRNQELEYQSKNIKESEIKLQEKQELLSQINEELESQKNITQKRIADLEKEKIQIDEKVKQLLSENKTLSLHLNYISNLFKTKLKSIINLTEKLPAKKDYIFNENDLKVCDDIKISFNEILNNIEDSSISSLDGFEQLIHQINKTDNKLIESETKEDTEKKDYNENNKKQIKIKKDNNIKDVNSKTHIEEDDRDSILENDRTILIIEDDTTFAKMLKKISKEHNFKCLIALNGNDGLKLAKQYKPDAIILDISLPDINGWLVLSCLKDDSETRHIPVHFISAYDKDKLSQAMKMGAVDYLIKPVSIENLKHVYENLHKMLSKSFKDLLIIVDDDEKLKKISSILGDNDIKQTIANEAQKLFDELLKEDYDCIIFDYDNEIISIVDFFDKIQSDNRLKKLPIIVFTQKQLSKNEQELIAKYSLQSPVKQADSYERLLAETTLFLHRIESDLPEEKRELIQSIYKNKRNLQNKKILIVDDDMRNVYSLKKTLSEHGIKILIGKNGKHGIDVLQKNHDVNLILMDIMMPEMNGYDAMTSIRNIENFKNIPIIALTAKNMNGEREKCIKSGASDYLAKPIDIDRLFSLLKVWLYNT